MNNIIITNGNTGNSTTNTIPVDEDILLKQIKDDDYYIDRKGLIPPRFHYYNHIKALRYDISECLYVTQDELDFGLKRQLKMSPEERYQLAKSNRFCHKQGSFYRELSSDDWNKGCIGDECIPECEYYPEYGRIEDEQIIEEHREHERYYRNKNQLISIDIDEKEFKEFLKDNPYLLKVQNILQKL